MHQQKENSVITVKVKTKNFTAQKNVILKKSLRALNATLGGVEIPCPPPAGPPRPPVGSNTALCNVYVRDNHALLLETRNWMDPGSDAFFPGTEMFGSKLDGLIVLFLND